MRIYALTFIYIVLQAASILLPRYALNPGEGFVSAAEATLIFFGFQLLAGLLAVSQFLYTYRTRHKLTRPQVIIGMLPLGITILGSIIFIAIFRYR